MSSSPHPVTTLMRDIPLLYMTVPELKSVAKYRGVYVRSGNTRGMILTRLRNLAGASTPEQDRAVMATTVLPHVLSRLPKPDLMAEAKTRGLVMSGTKAQLVERVTQARLAEQALLKDGVVGYQSWPMEKLRSLAKDRGIDDSGVLRKLDLVALLEKDEQAEYEYEWEYIDDPSSTDDHPSNHPDHTDHTADHTDYPDEYEYSSSSCEPTPATSSTPPELIWDGTKWAPIIQDHEVAEDPWMVSLSPSSHHRRRRRHARKRKSPRKRRVRKGKRDRSILDTCLLLDCVPDEVFVYGIYPLLDGPSFRALAQTCTRLYQIAHDQVMLTSRLLQDIRALFPLAQIAPKGYAKLPEAPWIVLSDVVASEMAEDAAAAAAAAASSSSSSSVPATPDPALFAGSLPKAKDIPRCHIQVQIPDDVQTLFLMQTILNRQCKKCLQPCLYVDKYYLCPCYLATGNRAGYAWERNLPVVPTYASKQLRKIHGSTASSRSWYGSNRPLFADVLALVAAYAGPMAVHTLLAQIKTRLRDDIFNTSESCTRDVVALYPQFFAPNPSPPGESTTNKLLHRHYLAYPDSFMSVTTGVDRMSREYLTKFVPSLQTYNTYKVPVSALEDMGKAWRDSVIERHTTRLAAKVSGILTFAEMVREATLAEASQVFQDPGARMPLLELFLHVPQSLFHIRFTPQKVFGFRKYIRHDAMDDEPSMKRIAATIASLRIILYVAWVHAKDFVAFDSHDTPQPDPTAPDFRNSLDLYLTSPIAFCYGLHNIRPTNQGKNATCLTLIRAATKIKITDSPDRATNALRKRALLALRSLDPRSGHGSDLCTTALGPNPFKPTSISPSPSPSHSSKSKSKSKSEAKSTE